MASRAIRTLLACCALSCGADRPLQMFEAVEAHMGTLVRIKLYAADAAIAKAGFAAAFARIAELDRILSDYDPASELNRLCTSPEGSPVKIGDDLFRVLRASQELAEESGGAFDVTQGPVIRLWRAARKDHLLPDAGALKEAAARGGYRKLRLDRSRRMARLDLEGMQLDLGGIAKGYAADAALEVLVRWGISSALVAMSGDLAFSHAPPGERGWKVSLGSPERVFELSDGAVSTSGDEEQFVELGGKRYSHIIDPATGMALTNGVTSSVVARRGMVADGLATALCVLGADRGMELMAKHRDAGAMISNREGVVVESPGFPISRRRLQ